MIGGNTPAPRGVCSPVVMDAPRLIAAAALALLIVGAPAATATEPNDDPDAAIYLDLQRGRLRTARARIEAELARRPHDETLLYLAATTASRLGNADRGAELLHEAVRAGFLDFDMIRHDPDLDCVRDAPMYRAIVEAEEEFLAHRGPEPPLASWRDIYGLESYRLERDPRRRLTWVHALPPETMRGVRKTLERLADHLAATLFEAPPGYHCLVALPTPPHADRHFQGRDTLGGVYEHDRRRLVARDIGASLRHEFVHLMHFGDMDRRRQHHPIWLLEALASLYEDVEFDERSGAARFPANYRDDSARILLETDRLPSIEALIDLDHRTFMSDPGRHYAAARSLLRHVAEHGLLPDFYRAFVTGFDDDPSGRVALESVLQRRIDGIETQWRTWIADLAPPRDDVELGAGGTGLVTDVRGSSEGVLVTAVEKASAAARAGLRAGDVILAVDDRPTPSWLELRGVIARMKPGRWIELRLRRDGHRETVALKLAPAGPRD